MGRTYQTLALHKIKHVAPLTEPHIPLMGEPVGEIEVPRLGLRAAILEGDSVEILRLGVGHLPGTPLPGEQGNVALAAHRDTFFRSLKDIRRGDRIVVLTAGKVLQYQVGVVKIVSPQSVEVLQPADENELTLITCFPFNYVGPAPKRFVVQASEMAVTSPRTP